MPRSVPRPFHSPLAALVLVLTAALAAALAGACGGDSAPGPTPRPPASSTPLPSATPFPTFTPTPALEAGVAIVVGGDLRTRSEPSTRGPVVRTLPDQARLEIADALLGENWLVGTQTWVPAVPEWTRLWYRLADGTFVYAGFVFILQPGEVSPLIEAPGQEKWIDVNVATQTVTAMVGDRAVYTARASSGSPQFPTPLGTHHIEDDGRLAVERMTSSQAGYDPRQASYNVERVLFTQYFDRNGNALHLNYWRPAGVFGRTPTSHGCVGMQLHDAQYFWLFAEPDTRVEIHA